MSPSQSSDRINRQGKFHVYFDRYIHSSSVKARQVECSLKIQLEIDERWQFGNFSPQMR